MNVTDQWVVLIDPVRMSAEEMAKLQELARTEQATINEMLTAVGDADDETANAVAAAGSRFGYAESGELNGPFAIPGATRPRDEVPNPKELPGMMARKRFERPIGSMNVREVVESTNQYGEEVTTVIKQDGSKAGHHPACDPFEWASKENFYEIGGVRQGRRFRGARPAPGTRCTTTAITPRSAGRRVSNLTISMDPTGYRTAGFTPAGGRSTQVPVELIDDISLVTGSGISGLEKHIVNGGSLPMLTAESIENVSKAAKFGGPALEVATTVFDMAMADSDKERCIALVAGIGGAGGGWAGAEVVRRPARLAGPCAFVTVPFGAFAGGISEGLGGAKMGEFIGEVVCPY